MQASNAGLFAAGQSRARRFAILAVLLLLAALAAFLVAARPFQVRNLRTLESTLRDAGLGPRRLKVVVEEGATHSESAWAARLPEAPAFLFSARF